ncbi:MAG: hypothetical protein O3B31_10765, partial [Chloroflexi bacterium]|nr:hypothetical protein [Chloroflexota bacterium]
VVAMREGRAGHVTIANRTIERARALVALGGDELAIDVCALDVTSAPLRDAMGAAEIVIQATSLGLPHSPGAELSPIPTELFVRDQIVLDLVYGREPTPFVRAAMAAGARASDGLGMLVHQGAASFTLWTGHEAPLDVMFAAARAAVAG